MTNQTFPHQIFKEYDIRGLFEKEFTEDIIKKIGYFLGLEIKKIEDKVCVGYDCRTHSPTCFNWLISGLNHAGLKVINLGEVPTPVTYYSGYHSEIKCKSNIMITASHNPKEYNGFKMNINNRSFFGEDIKKLGETIEASEIEIPDNHECEEYDIISPYVNLLTTKFEHLKNFDKKIIFDCGNGMSGPTLKRILDNLNLNYELMYEKPDGNFPNHPADPSVRENLNDIIEHLNTQNVELGFAHDGDSDRIYTVLKSGPINPDILAILLAKTIKNPKVIGEVKCSQVMYDEINKIGTTIMSKTGHSNIKKLIAENLDTSFAIELSGHVFFKDKYFGYDDAIYSSFRIIELEHGKIDFEKEIKKIPKVYTTPEVKVEIPDEKKFNIVNDFIKAVKTSEMYYKNLIETDGVRIEFGNGWGLVRASNTSPILSTRFESETKAQAEEYQEKVMKILNELI